DYVRAMWLMLQQPEPNDYVVATGETHSVRELADWAFAHVGLDADEHVEVAESLKRGTAELHDIVGDATRARTVLKWTPSMRLSELIAAMVDADISQLRRTRGHQGVVG